MNIKNMGVFFWGHPVYQTTKLHNIITFGSYDESLRVLVIVDLLMSLAVPTVPAVYALVQVPVTVGGAALQQVVLQLVFPENEIGLDIILNYKRLCLSVSHIISFHHYNEPTSAVTMI